MKTFPAIATLLGRLAFAAFAGAATAATAADIRIDEASVEPLPGRDYSMRLDMAAARFEQIDPHSGNVVARGFSAECAASLAQGLWLAVPAAGDRLELLPLGLTADRALAVSAGCDTAAAQSATLPPALLAQIAARGGGVIFIDGAGLDAAGSLAASQATP